MSQILYALVILQGSSGLTFSPGFTTAAECMQQYKGPYVSCFAYDPDGTSWTAFFKLPNGGFRAVWRIRSEDECRQYIGAFKDDTPAACRQLAMPNVCTAACRPAEPPPPPAPPAAKPEPDRKPVPQAPDPAALTYRLGQECETGWSQQKCSRWRLEAAPVKATTPAIQLAGGHYEDGFRWVEDMDGVKAADRPFIEPRVVQEPRKTRTLAPPTQTLPEPFKALVDVVMLPFDFLSYPGRRDW